MFLQWLDIRSKSVKLQRSNESIKLFDKHFEIETDRLQPIFISYLLKNIDFIIY